MKDLVVVTFANEEAGREALSRVRELAAAGQLDVADSAVITKDADGKTHVTNEVSSDTKTGTIIGGFLGLLLGLFFLPVFGIVAGGAIGALLARSVGQSVDPKFVDEVTAELSPGTSALFVLAQGSSGALVQALRPFQGKVFQTTLDTDLEQALNDALRASG
ncbi:MAG TPA: DUF1269 domain-containing protein [Candidatus Limnocylindrales bacterium]|nr:DUF1269 domain-containing protein [Candidatus Limnocylindrales bacterium]